MLLPVRDAQGNTARPLLWKFWYSDGGSQDVATITGSSSLGHCILSMTPSNLSMTDMPPQTR